MGQSEARMGAANIGDKICAPAGFAHRSAAAGRGWSDRFQPADEIIAPRRHILASHAVHHPVASFEPFVDSFIAGAAEGGTNLTRSEAQCAIRALETDGDEEEILACLSDETLDSIEDPTIDLLSDQCRRGNNQACDELYRSAPEGSDASIYGMTCANRLPKGTGFTCFDELG